MDRMKDYKQLIKELPSNTFVCALGEFNPPTTSHELLVNTVKVVSERYRADHSIYISPSDLISEDKKTQFLQLVFPRAKFQSLGETFFASTIKRLTEKYRKVIIVAGADQFAEFKKLKESSKVEIISIGTKDPDANAAKMSQYASKGIYEDFKKLLPSNIRDIDARRLMNEMRIASGLESIKEHIHLVKDKLREKYFRGEVFNEGEIVESAGKQYTIIKRGSNHLLLKEETGELVSKWIHDVAPVKQKMKTEAVIQPNGTDKIETNAPESDTGAKQSPLPKGKTKGFLTFYNYSTKENGDAMQEQLTIASETCCGESPDTSTSVAKSDQLQDRKKQLKRLKSQVEMPEGEPVDKPSQSIPASQRPFDPFFKETHDFDLTDDDINSMVEDVTDAEIEDLYEEHEIALVYEDTGEEVEKHPEEFKLDLMEVLSRQERLKGKIRLRKTAAKRGRSTKIALKRYSSTQTINKRARRLAIKLIKKRMLRGRDPLKISVGEKERIERQLSKNRKLVDRVAQKLVVRVRRVEQSRMSKTKKGSAPTVF